MDYEKFRWLARSGYVARGVVFLLVAGLALFSGVAGGEADTKPALDMLLQQPLGRIWLGVIAIGLFGFVGWRLAQSVADADGHGDDAKALMIRAALLGSAITYIGLALYALMEAFDFSRGSGSGGEKGLVQWIMSQPFGSYLAIMVGAGFIAGGGITMYKGISQSFRKYLKINGDRYSPVALVCVYGLVARGFVFAIVGGLIMYGGVTVDPQQAGSTSDALNWVRRLPFGTPLYLAVAIGLAAFGLYNLIEARHRMMRMPTMPDFKRALPRR